MGKLTISANEPCPKAGEGVNHWINRRVIYLLIQRVENSRIMSMVKSECRDCGRDVSQDIKHSINTGIRLLNLRRSGVGNPAGEAVEKFDRMINLRLVQQLLTDVKYTDWDLDRYRIESREVEACDAIQQLFGESKIICGRHRYQANIQFARDFTNVNSFRLSEFQFIVPTPALGFLGVNKEGKPSIRCLDNLEANRRYLVIEFDAVRDLNNQCRMFRRLSEEQRLVMIVYSGGKSLHAWFYVADNKETENRSFMQFAISIGADPSTWVKCQYVRIPGGTNTKTKKEQKLEYFNLQDGTH